MSSLKRAAETSKKLKIELEEEPYYVKKRKTFDEADIYKDEMLRVYVVNGIDYQICINCQYASSETDGWVDCEACQKAICPECANNHSTALCRGCQD